MKKLFGYIVIIGIAALCIGTAPAQAQECDMQISLLTCSPGEELYSTFGHSAIRIIDSSANRDVVFNYGTFNFEEPHFYMKFIRGKLNYFVSAENFEDFRYAYELENRSITEQVLNLTCEEKEAIKQFLLWNLLPENRNYKYDFTFDNCTTRLADIIEKNTGSTITYPRTQSDAVTFRDAIHEYLNDGHEWWSRLGIDILLGSRLDRKMTNREYLFLPDNLMDGLDSTTTHSGSIIKEKEDILRARWVPDDTNNITTPIFIFLCLFVIIGLLSFSHQPAIKSSLVFFDKTLFFLNGLTGILLLFMWFGTDHFMTKANYNLLWAWPLNIIAAFYIHSGKKWSKIYFLIFAIFQIIIALSWFYLPQKMNIALLPIIGILIYRSLLYARFDKNTSTKDKDPEHKEVH